jgi:hypothetical protein
VSAASDVAATPPGPGPHRHARVAGLAAVAAVAFGTAWLTWPRPTVELRVEPGGHASLSAGRWGAAERPLPDTVRVPLRGGRATVRVTNGDRRWHQLGAFGAGPGQTRDYVVSEPAVLSGACAAHPAGGITYIVE